MSRIPVPALALGVILPGPLVMLFGPSRGWLVAVLIAVQLVFLGLLIARKPWRRRS